jgi:CRP-like cAMP-binding protein
MRNQAAVQLQAPPPLGRKNGLRLSSKPAPLKNGDLPEPKSEDEDDDDSSLSDNRSHTRELSIAESQMTSSRPFRAKRQLALLRHVLVFVLRINKLLEYRKLYGVPKYTLNPHFKPLELIRRNLNYNSKRYGSGTKNSLQTSLMATAQKRSAWLFYPNQIGIQIWFLMNILIISYLLLYVPPSLAFSIEGLFFKVFDYFIDAFFIVDLLLNFNIAFQLPDGSYETNRWAIAKHYVFSQFAIDLLSSLPFSWIDDAGINWPVQYNKVLRGLKLPKLMATLRVTRNFDLSIILTNLKLGDTWKYSIKSKEGAFRTMFLVLLILLAIHIGACIWIIIGTLESFGNQTWIISEGYSNLTDFGLYLTAFYYCLVVFTTVGYGDVSSVNNLERSFTILWMMFGIAFYSFVISFVTQHFTNIDTPKSLLVKKLKHLKSFSDSKHLPSRLFYAIRKNLQYASSVISYRWLEPSKSFLTNLPLELKYQFSRELHREVLRSPFFDSNNDAFAVRILECLKPVKLRRNQFVWSKNDIPSNIVFIVEGKMFYMMNNVYYRSPEKRSQEERERNQMVEIESERRCLAKEEEEANVEESQKPPERAPRMSYLKFVKLFKFFGQKDVERNLGTNNRMDNEFKNTAQIRRHLLLDASKTDDLKDLPIVSFRLFGPGSYLGEEEIIWPSPRKYYLKAATDVQLMVLARTDFDKIVKEDFPQIYKKLTDHALVRSGWFDGIKKKVLKKISESLKKTNAKQFHSETKNLIEKSVYKLRKERQIHEIPSLDHIIDSTEDASIFQGILDVHSTDSLDPNEHRRRQTVARERAKSPGLMKIYSTWRSKLTRAPQGAIAKNGREQLAGHSRALRDDERVQ